MPDIGFASDLGVPDHVRFTVHPAKMIRRILAELEPTRVFVITDGNAARHCLPLVAAALPEHTVLPLRPGEARKTLDTCREIWRAMVEAGLDRRSLVVNLGGGVVCDMGGFCAATFKRGLSFIHCPTTLLAQVDASVGGKLGVDFDAYKNLVGLFREPDRVVVSGMFLDTLPPRELRCGYAEMIKHALIAGGDDWEVQQSADMSRPPSTERIARSIAIKQAVVSGDPTEKGVRKMLNFGHTVGHAVESVLLRGENVAVTHGEAVAVGLVAESWLSRQYLGLGHDELEDIVRHMGNVFPGIDLAGISRSLFVDALLQDKKNAAGTILAVLLDGIGHCVVDVPVPPEACWEALEFCSRT